jgi:hypothetical protein
MTLTQKITEIFFCKKNNSGGINDIFENNARINIKMKYLQNTEILYKANYKKMFVIYLVNYYCLFVKCAVNLSLWS